jgi:hypothetical protein
MAVTWNGQVKMLAHATASIAGKFGYDKEMSFNGVVVWLHEEAGGEPPTWTSLAGSLADPPEAESSLARPAADSEPSPLEPVTPSIITRALQRLSCLFTLDAICQGQSTAQEMADGSDNPNVSEFAENAAAFNSVGYQAQYGPPATKPKSDGTPFSEEEHGSQAGELQRLHETLQKEPVDGENLKAIFSTDFAKKEAALSRAALKNLNAMATTALERERNSPRRSSRAPAATASAQASFTAMTVQEHNLDFLCNGSRPLLRRQW